MGERELTSTVLIGISASIPVYRFCWMVNNSLEINFTCMPELFISGTEKNVNCTFPVYQYLLPNSEHLYMLYKQKVGSYLLIPGLKVNLLWLIETAQAGADAARIMAHLKSLPGVDYVTLLDPKLLKNINRLVVY
jgi:hypothetical protein